MPLIRLTIPLVLASTSRYRQAQLARLGLPFAAVKPPHEELPIPGLGATQLIAHHAREKAKAVHALSNCAQRLVLAADQGVVLDQELLGKPGTAQAAVEQLLRLAGREHALVTAVVLCLPDGRLLERLVPVALRLRPLSEVEAQAYVEQDQPLDCAGSYRIEGAGPSLLEWARGDDPTAIEGLPMIAVSQLLREAAGWSP